MKSVYYEECWWNLWHYGEEYKFVYNLTEATFVLYSIAKQFKSINWWNPMKQYIQIHVAHLAYLVYYSL